MVERDIIVDGRQQRVRQREARINWTPTSGQVQNSFDDITIGASKTISHSILNSLTPWHTQHLIPFDERYLSGFKAEEYTIGLDNAFEYAKMKIDKIVEQDIRRDIGGDQQRIDTIYPPLHIHTQNTCTHVHTCNIT